MRRGRIPTGAAADEGSPPCRSCRVRRHPVPARSLRGRQTVGAWPRSGGPWRLAARRGVTHCAPGRAGALWGTWLRSAVRSRDRGLRLLSSRGGMAEPGPGLQAEVGKVDEEKETAAPAPKKRRLAAGERYVPPPRKLRSGVSFSAAHFAETSYYFEGGLRKVRPYYYDFRTYCKGRWVGRSLLHVFSTEFRAQPLSYYRAAARAGRLRLNEEPVQDLDVVLKVGGSAAGWEPPVVASRG